MNVYIRGIADDYLVLDLENITVTLPCNVISHQEIVPLMEALEQALETLNKAARRKEKQARAG